jgi:uncharacterized iron-regulated membrane protein
MSLRKIIGKIHLWLGLSSGLVVFVVGITGCLYVFKDEIQQWYAFDKTVENTENVVLLPSQIKQIATSYDSNHVVHSINYGHSNEAIEVAFYQEEPEPYYASLFVHPATGKVMHHEVHTTGFFDIVLAGHYNLWLPKWIGKPIVASATLIFVILLISGIVLWWPRNKNARGQRFKINWKLTTSKKRRNYDLHNVLGFYASVLALVLAFTGLVWGFEWFAKASYNAIGGSKSLTYAPPFSGSGKTNENEPVDQIFKRIQPGYQNRVSDVEYHFPETKRESIYVFVRRDDDTYYRSDYRYFDQYTTKEISVNQLWGRYDQASNSDKLFRMNYDIHVGAIGGITGKIIAFFISLICASLPVTGFLIWRWRKKKKVNQGDLRRTATSKFHEQSY